MAKSSINIKALGGIDARHTREIGRFSSGKNFYTHSGALRTRPGSTEIPSDFTQDVKALFKAGMPTMTTRLLAQAGSRLYHKVDDTWSQIGSVLTVNKILHGTRFINKLILVDGPDRLIYDIATGEITSAVVEGDTAMPELEYVITWKSRVFGWAPNYAGSNFLRFCGYDPADATIIDLTVWPPDFTLDISGESSSPILAVLPMQSHLLCLSKNSFWQVYGNTEEDFSIQHAGFTSVLNPDVCCAVGDAAIWLGLENNKPVVYTYTGTSPVPISERIDDLLQGMSLDDVIAFPFYNQYWLVFQDTGHCHIFIYDIVEAEWFYYEYPFTVKCACMFGDYLDPDLLYIGTADNNIFELSYKTDTDIGEIITTDMVLGPFDLDSRQFKAKTLYINAEVKSNFSLGVTVNIDGINLPTKTIDFATTEGSVVKTVKLNKKKGRVCKISFTTTDKINEIQKLDLTVKPKAVK